MPESLPSFAPKDLLGWRHFSHVADIGVMGFGPGPHWAFEQAAMAMTAVITDQHIDLPDYATIFCEGESLEDLFVAWLNALVYEMAVRNMIFGGYVVRIADRRLCGAAYGETIDQKKHQPACEVKGATYTELRVAKSESGIWTAQCVIDV
jgi:tRNA nucleotidyltransferase (CCA-adding enzyme)